MALLYESMNFFSIVMNNSSQLIPRVYLSVRVGVIRLGVQSYAESKLRKKKVEKNTRKTSVSHILGRLLLG